MKIRQNLRHWAAKNALTAPVLGDIANDKLVDMHTDIFLGKADEDAREARRDHLDGFFDATMDTYVAALKAGFPEAQAREITHIQANFDFFNHGWTEMMEIPAEEFEQHFRRYEAFFKRYGITVDDPLGEFRPADGIPTAPETPNSAISRPTRTRSPALPTTCTSRTATANSTSAPEPPNPPTPIRQTPPE
jgi:hypothetical protein